MDNKTYFAVELWQSHPDEDNDDCMQSYDFNDLASAQRAYDNPHDELSANLALISHLRICRITLHGKREYVDPINVRQVMTDAQISKRLAEREREREAFDSEWSRELAMEAGMLYGVCAYNDHMGY